MAKTPQFARLEPGAPLDSHSLHDGQGWPDERGPSGDRRTRTLGRPWRGRTGHYKVGKLGTLQAQRSAQLAPKLLCGLSWGLLAQRQALDFATPDPARKQLQGEGSSPGEVERRQGL